MTNILSKIGGIALLVFVSIGAGYVLHKTPPQLPPRPAVIIHDTIPIIKFKFDSAALKKAIAALHPDTVWLTHETVTPPETISVVPPITALTLLHAGEQLGDTGYAQGIATKPLSNGQYAFHNWQAKWVTPGPLGAIYLDSLGNLRVHFYDPPPPPCTLKDRAQSGAIVAGGVELLRLVLGRP